MTEVVSSFSDLHINNDITWSTFNGSYLRCTWHSGSTFWDHPRLLSIKQSAKKRIKALMFWWRPTCSVAERTLCLPFLSSLPEPALFRTPLSCHNCRWGGLCPAQCQTSHWLHQLDEVNSLLPNLNTSLVLFPPTTAIRLGAHKMQNTESLNALWNTGSLWTWVQCSKLNKWLKGLEAVYHCVCLSTPTCVTLSVGLLHLWLCSLKSEPVA